MSVPTAFLRKTERKFVQSGASWQTPTNSAPSNRPLAK